MISQKKTNFQNTWKDKYFASPSANKLGFSESLELNSTVA